MFIVAIVATLSFLAACSGGNKDQIVRKWKFSEMQSPMMDRMMKENEAKCMAMDDSMKNCMDTMKMKEYKSSKEMMESQKTMMNNMMDKMKSEGWIEFTKEGKYKQNMSGTEDEGTYALDEAGKMLMTTDSKGKTDTLNIDELSADKMTLSTPKDSTKIIFTAAADEKK